MQIQFSPPAIIAHRGASAYAPENTLAAFHKAMEARADGIELDVHLSADGEVVVIHDADLSRTTNGQGKVHQTTLAELRKLDAGGEPVPMLEEVLQILDDRTFLNIELKGINRLLPAQVLKLVKKYDKEGQVVYSSFNPRLLKKLNLLSPHSSAGLLLLPGFPGRLVQWMFESSLNLWSLHPHFSLVDKAYMHTAKQKGYRVFAYTVNHPEDVDRLLNDGIDGIITDNPSAAADLVKKYHEA